MPIRLFSLPPPTLSVRCSLASSINRPLLRCLMPRPIPLESCSSKSSSLHLTDHLRHEPHDIIDAITEIICPSRSSGLGTLFQPNHRKISVRKRNYTPQNTETETRLTLCNSLGIEPKIWEWSKSWQLKPELTFWFRYVYLDKADITLENALPVLYIAKKYLITGLHKATVSYLRSHIKASNICQFLPSLYLFEELTDM